MKRLFVALAFACALILLLASPARAEGPPPRAVTVGTYVNRIYGVDIKNNQFTVDFYVWFRWHGDDVSPLDSFEILGGRVVSKDAVGKKILEGDLHYATARIVAVITRVWDLRRYPLDGHTLDLEIEDGQHDSRSLAYQLDSENIGTSPDFEVPGWRVTTTRSAVGDHAYRTNYGDTTVPTNHESTYARYRFSVDVVQPGYGRFLKVFFGLFVSVLVSWCAFWVRPKESSPRVSLGVGATFAAAAVTVTINNSLPDTSAVTMADKLIMLTLGMIVASLAVTIAALALYAKDKEALQQRMDRTCAWIFPIAYVIILAIVVRT